LLVYILSILIQLLALVLDEIEKLLGTEHLLILHEVGVLGLQRMQILHQLMLLVLVNVVQ